MAEDRKFRFDHNIRMFINRLSGEPIPHDEPVILFRARDIHSLRVLDFYHDLVEDPHHAQAIRERIEEFALFMRMNPHRMKEPGITHHVELHTSRRDLHESRRHESSQDQRLDRLEHEEASLERKMEHAMADIDILNSVLGNIANDAATLTANFKNLEGELQAAQEAAANNQPIDLSSSILLARQAQSALDGIVAAAGEAGVGPAAAPSDTSGAGSTDTSGAGSTDTSGSGVDTSGAGSGDDTSGAGSADTSGAGADTSGSGAGGDDTSGLGSGDDTGAGAGDDASGLGSGDDTVTE